MRYSTTTKYPAKKIDRNLDKRSITLPVFLSSPSTSNIDRNKMMAGGWWSPSGLFRPEANVIVGLCVCVCVCVCVCFSVGLLFLSFFSFSSSFFFFFSFCFVSFFFSFIFFFFFFFVFFFFFCFFHFWPTIDRSRSSCESVSTSVRRKIGPHRSMVRNSSRV